MRDAAYPVRNGPRDDTPAPERPVRVVSPEAAGDPSLIWYPLTRARDIVRVAFGSALLPLSHLGLVVGIAVGVVVG